MIHRGSADNQTENLMESSLTVASAGNKVRVVAKEMGARVSIGKGRGVGFGNGQRVARPALMIFNGASGPIGLG